MNGQVHKKDVMTRKQAVERLQTHFAFGHRQPYLPTSQPVEKCKECKRLFAALDKAEAA